MGVDLGSRWLGFLERVRTGPDDYLAACGVGETGGWVRVRPTGLTQPDPPASLHV